MSSVNFPSSYSTHSYGVGNIGSPYSAQKKEKAPPLDAEQMERMQQLLELLMQMVQPPADQLVMQLMQMLNNGQQPDSGGFDKVGGAQGAGGAGGARGARGGGLDDMMLQMEQLLMMMLQEIQRLTQGDDMMDMMNQMESSGAGDSGGYGGGGDGGGGGYDAGGGNYDAGYDSGYESGGEGGGVGEGGAVSGPEGLALPAGQDPTIPSKSGYPQLDQWDQQIQAASEKTGVPANYIKATIWAESRGNPNDPSLNPDGQHIDEGVMQISDHTYNNVVKPNNPDAPDGLKAGNTADNIMMGAFELKTYLDKNGGNLANASAEYVGEEAGNPGYSNDVLGFYDSLNKGIKLKD